ncbi:MAG: hypothetical protein MUO76_14425 [Anaerolineaceae bacterium]|nr:hypothetical protein [Anaerolineaceae bacterium]
MKRISYKIFLLLTTLEGIFPVFLLLRDPSMDRNASYFGYSTMRLTQGAGIILLILFLAGITIAYSFNKDLQDQVTDRIEQWLANGDRLLISQIVLLIFFLSGVFAVWLILRESTIDLNLLEVVFDRLGGVLIWWLLIMFQAVVLLAVNFWHFFSRKASYKFPVIFKTIVILFLLDLSIYHWMILIFQIQSLVSIPYWTWYFHEKEANVLIFLLLILISFFVVKQVLKKQQSHKSSLVLLILLGYVIQVGFGFIEGMGFESLREKSISAGHVKYLEYAVDNPLLSDALFNYEQAFGWDIFLGTKPPGIMIFYILDQKLSNSINPVNGYQARFDRLSRFNAYLFPLLTFLGLIALFLVSKSLMTEDDAIFPCIMFLFLPNIILMPLELDQVLFPTLFMLGVFMTWKTIQTQSLKWAFFTGIMIYLAIFFTFALLPLLPLSFLWIGLEHLRTHSFRKLDKVVKIILMVSAGIILIFFLFQFILNYDLLLRYNNAMGIHRMLMNFEPGFDQILEAFRLNNLEIASWIGFPIALLFILRVGNTVIAFIRKNASYLDGLTAAFVITYLLLNFIGQTRGEVGRLWLFMTPLFSLFAAAEIVRLFKNKNMMTMYVLSLQFITIFITFKFQDYW